jgi:hypothetical protein
LQGAGPLNRRPYSTYPHELTKETIQDEPGRASEIQQIASTACNLNGLKYEDAEGDLITLASQNDLNELLSDESGTFTCHVGLSEEAYSRPGLVTSPSAIDESMELAIHVHVEEPLLNLQRLTPELDPNVPLPAHVKLLHWVLFAQGSRWPRLQLITTYGLYFAWQAQIIWDALSVNRSRHNLVSVFGSSLLLLETIVNAFLCYKLCKHNQVQRLIKWANSQQSGDITSPISSLRKVAWGGWVVLLLAGVFYSYVSISDYMVVNWIESAVMLTFGSVMPTLAFGMLFYLCFLWFWMNWVLHTAAQHWVQHRLDADSVLGVGGKDAGKELWEILAQMKEVSSMWANNHAARLVTTTGIATAFLILAEYELHGDCGIDECGSDEPGIVSQLAVAAMMYTMVWLMAAVPGYITDMLFSNLHRKLYMMRLVPDTNQVDGQIPATSTGLPVLAPQQLQPLTPLEAKATALMQQAHHLQGREGMHFAFVPMSLARAITVGTVLGYTIAFATRISH